MRATEFLTEQTTPDDSKLIAKAGDLWLWEVPVSVYVPVYEKEKSDPHYPALPLPANAQQIYYVSDQERMEGYEHASNTYVYADLTPDQAVKLYSHQYRFFTSQGNELISLAGRKYLSPGLLKKLAKLTGTQHAPAIDAQDVKKHVLYKGDVRHINQVREDYALAPLTSGAKVYQIPKQLLWTVGIKFHNDAPTSWDTRWYIESPIVGTYSLTGTGDTITKHWFPPNKAVAAVKEIQELAKREGLKLAIQLPDVAAATGKAKTVKPNSVMHKMLAYVADHPGAARSDWFVKHLGYSPAGMVGWTDDKAHDGVAAGMGWIKNEGSGSKYSLHITPMGKLVLARLNAGHPVQHTRQV